MRNENGAGPFHKCFNSWWPKSCFDEINHPSGKISKAADCGKLTRSLLAIFRDALNNETVVFLLLSVLCLEKHDIPEVCLL